MENMINNNNNNNDYKEKINPEKEKKEEEEYQEYEIYILKKNREIYEWLRDTYDSYMCLNFNKNLNKEHYVIYNKIIDE
jgi:hypothetical protein